MYTNTHYMVLDDPEFEVTAEMLVHQDLDDEATLEEEEAATQPEDVQEELAGLEQVQVMYLAFGGFIW